MRLVDVRELHTMQRESPGFVKELSLPVWWFGRPKAPLKKLLCFVINVVVLPCPPIHHQTFFALMAFHPMKVDSDGEVLDYISDDLNIVKGALTN